MEKKLVDIDFLDEERFLNVVWYERYRVPNSFEKDAFNVTAVYTKCEDGGVRVTNRKTFFTALFHKRMEGEAIGEAHRVGPGHLKVSFDPARLFRGDYCVYLGDLEKGYLFVSDLNLNLGWILTRDKTTDVSFLKDQLKNLGFNVEKLQPCAHDQWSQSENETQQ